MDTAEIEEYYWQPASPPTSAFALGAVYGEHDVLTRLARHEPLLVNRREVAKRARDRAVRVEGYEQGRAMVLFMAGYVRRYVFLRLAYHVFIRTPSAGVIRGMAHTLLVNRFTVAVANNELAYMLEHGHLRHPIQTSQGQPHVTSTDCP